MDDMIGKQLDQYLVQQFVARGGMAEVYLATDVNLQRPVALKIMLPQLAMDKTATSRFQREAEAVARLNHANIIQIYTTGLTPDKRPYLAMQYVSGGSLQEKLAQLSRQGHQMALADVLWMCRQVADAMQVAHRHDIVHRDLKPSNILLKDDGDPAVTDLGIAAVGNEQTRLTQTGTVMGTPHYMAPEQALGKPIDGRTDIYALGIILYEMLTGNVPFSTGSPLSILHQHISTPPRPLSQIKPGLPDNVYYIVDKCLEKEPENRFQSAGALVSALDQCLMDEGVITPRALPTYQQPTPPQKRTWWSWALGAVLLLLIGTGLGFVYFLNRDVVRPTLGAEILLAEPTATMQILPSVTSFVSEEIATIEMMNIDPGCNGESEGQVYVGEDGDVCFAESKIFEMAVDATGCFYVGDISSSPAGGYFVVIANCFEGDNKAFLYREDGSEKREITADWDFVNYEFYKWLPDGGSFVYERINSCCQTAPPDAPPPGVVWYDPATGEKTMPDTPSPLDSYHVAAVANNDVLNIYSGPGNDYTSLGTIPHNGTGIEVAGRRVVDHQVTWVPIRFQNQEGWVDSYHLVSDTVVVDPIVPPQEARDLYAGLFLEPPKIDAYFPEWPVVPSYLTPYRVYNDPSWNGTDDIEAVWRLGWDYENLYIAVDVTDDVHVQTLMDKHIYKGDGIEIQIDADLAGDYGTDANADDYQVNLSPGDFFAVSKAAYLWQDLVTEISGHGIRLDAREKADGGYFLEAAVPWRDINVFPVEGLQIGIALNVDDNDSPGTAVQEVLMSHVNTRSFSQPSSWGTLTLQP